MNKSDIYKHVDDCLLEDMDGELLLYNPANATTLHLNGPSSIVWELCNGTNSVQDMIDAVQHAYPEQHDQIESDIVGVLKEFIERQFLVLLA